MASIHQAILGTPWLSPQKESGDWLGSLEPRTPSSALPCIDVPSSVASARLASPKAADGEKFCQGKPHFEKTPGEDVRNGHIRNGQARKMKPTCPGFPQTCQTQTTCKWVCDQTIIRCLEALRLNSVKEVSWESQAPRYVPRTSSRSLDS